MPIFGKWGQTLSSPFPYWAERLGLVLPMPVFGKRGGAGPPTPVYGKRGGVCHSPRPYFAKGTRPIHPPCPYVLKWGVAKGLEAQGAPKSPKRGRETSKAVPNNPPKPSKIPPKSTNPPLLPRHHRSQLGSRCCRCCLVRLGKLLGFWGFRGLFFKIFSRFLKAFLGIFGGILGVFWRGVWIFLKRILKGFC